MIKKGGKLILLLLTTVFSVFLVFFSIARYNGGDRISLTEQASIASSPWSVDGKININTATAEMLTQVPGIGDTLSERIVQYRETYGNYNNLSELRNIKGIGDETFNQIQDYLTTGEK